MRIVIKNADFSAVSIGKVVKDLSFSYGVGGDKTMQELPWINISNTSAALPWNDGNAIITSTNYLAATDSSESYTTANNAHRIISDFIEVTQGMVIKSNSSGATNVPSIICYNESKEALGPGNGYACWYEINSNEKIYTIPAGVKYIKYQATEVASSQYFKGEMPE